MPSNLDWTLITKGGRCAFIDTKTFDRKSFGLSLLNPRQLQLARRYADHGVISGFVVALRPLDLVCFFHAHLFSGLSRRSFTPIDGVKLGSVRRFNPSLIFSPLPS